VKIRFFAKYPYGVPAHLVKTHRVSGAEGLALETLPSDKAGDFYERRLAAGALPITSRLKRPSRCSITSWAPQILSLSARLPNSRPRKPTCVTTPLRNWESPCVNYAILFHLRRRFEGHRVQMFVKFRHGADSVFLHRPRGFVALLVILEPVFNRQPSHADIEARILDKNLVDLFVSRYFTL
jgi:hypothetical protein